jgi:hypothetical protein
VIELYCPPDHAAATAVPCGLWRGLVIAGAGLAGRIEGPEGIVIDGHP